MVNGASRRNGVRLSLLMSALLVVLASGGSRAARVTLQPSTPPPVAGGVTFLYFHDIERAAGFYGNVLGLEKTFDLGWVKIYAWSPTVSVGLVDATHGQLKPSADKPVMVSLIVDDVDAWYAYVTGQGVTVPKPPSDSSSPPIRSFSFTDPEGYALEVFTWLGQ